MFFSRLVICTILASIFYLPLQSAAIDLSKSATQYYPYLEWSLQNSTYVGNPYDLISFVVFTHTESGEEHTTHMFYDGGNTWRFRFTATQLGTWSVTTISSDSDLNGHGGSIIVTENSNNGAHGFMKKFDEKWGWTGTESAFAPQYVMVGDNEGSEPANFDSESKVNELIAEYMTGHGFSGFHIAVVAGRWFDKDKASNVVDPALKNPDPETFQALELLIVKTHLAGGSVHIWPWGDAQRGQTPKQLSGGMNGDVDQRLQRYIAARLGPIPGWSMGYGFDLDEWVTEAQLHTWRNQLQAFMGWHHFLGGRNVGPNSGTDHMGTVTWNTGMDYNAYEHHKPTYEVLVAAMESEPNQPVFSEDRFRLRDEGRSKDYNEVETRRGLWHGFMAGGAAGIWGNLQSGEVAPYSNKEHLQTHSRFFIDNHRFTPDMERDNSLTDGVCLKRPTNNHYIFYKEDTGAVQFNISAMSGPQPMVAVDAKAAYVEIPLGNYLPGSHTWTAPYVSDWGIAIGDFGNGAVSSLDSDNDGLLDEFENQYCTDPMDADTDDDGILDGGEEKNRNGSVDLGETNPCRLDSDGDGIQDGTEMGVTIDGVSPDTQLGIFVPDADPLSTTNPMLADTDRDGFDDGSEDSNHNGRLDAGETDPNGKNNLDAPSKILHPALKAAAQVSGKVGREK